MASIRVTPEELSTQGNELINYAGDLADTLSLIDGKIGEIIAGWDGLAQDAYFNMYETMKESLDKFLKEKYADGTLTALAEKYGVGLNTEALSAK